MEQNMKPGNGFKCLEEFIQDKDRILFLISGKRHSFKDIGISGWPFKKQVNLDPHFTSTLNKEDQGFK